MFDYSKYTTVLIHVPGVVASWRFVHYFSSCLCSVAFNLIRHIDVCLNNRLGVRFTQRLPRVTSLDSSVSAKICRSGIGVAPD